MQWMASESGAHPDLFAVPAGVEVYRRAAKDHEVFIVENDSHESQDIDLPAAMTNVLTRGTVRSLKLPVYGVAVLERSESKHE